MTTTDSPYEHPYPSPELAAEHPFITYEHERLSDDEMRRRADPPGYPFNNPVTLE